MDDLTLLRKYEPVVRFTQGELFFPCAVDGYLRRCSLWLRVEENTEQQLVPEGVVSTEIIGRYTQVPPRHTLFLRFVDRPLRALEYQRWLRRPRRPVFRAPLRLARVGLFSRILDAFFDTALAIRGKVPGGTAAAAEIKYRHMQLKDPRYVYYGRVIRKGGYTVLHYLFFYAMNNWRSGFYGVNDHEADWEQMFVYLSDHAGEEPVPLWVAYASHDFSGDDLRRRWDDPELQKVDEYHPVVFAGAGSHASYFQPGEYLMGIEPDFLLPVRNAIDGIRKFWVEGLGQGKIERVEKLVGNMLSVPFFDYARGDGVSIGPGQERGWTPIILDEKMGWVGHYRGLWGLDTRDPLGGERAPAGPKYNRDGSLRRSWFDPLGWAGLDKVSPPDKLAAQLKERIAALEDEQDTVARDVVQKRERVRLLAVETQALQQSDYFDPLYQSQRDKLNEAQNELQSLTARSAELTETWQASQSYLRKLEAGDWGDPQAHIRHKHLPEPSMDQHSRILEIWAAASGGLLLMALAALLIFAPSLRLAWALLIGGIFVAIEAAIRGRLENLLLNITIALAIITSLLLIKDSFWLIVILALLVIVVTTIVENLREIWGR